MEILIKSNDNHDVLVRNAYLEDKQLYIKNKKYFLYKIIARVVKCQL